jgi:hypothetical protein
VVDHPDTGAAHLEAHTPPFDPLEFPDLDAERMTEMRFVREWKIDDLREVEGP